jgi:6-pyruvoyltetrahydropterin/6-carboxytetrahydropterin synthase
MDFGGLKEFKSWADHMFDHTLVVAEDDPMLDFFKHMNEIVDIDSKDHLSKLPNERGALCDLRIVSAVGCEMFAKLAYDKMAELLKSGNMSYPINPTVRIKSVEVFEHGANSATYEGDA